MLQQLAAAQEQIAAVLQQELQQQPAQPSQQQQQQKVSWELIQEFLRLSCCCGRLMGAHCILNTAAVAEQGVVAVAAARLCNAVLKHPDRVYCECEDGLCMIIHEATCVMTMAVGCVHAAGVKVELPVVNAAQGSAGCCAGAGAGTCDITSHPDVLELVILLLCVISAALAASSNSSSTGSSGQAASSSSSNSNSRGAAGPTGTVATAAAGVADAAVADQAEGIINTMFQADSLTQLAKALWAKQGLTEPTLQQLAVAAVQRLGQLDHKLPGKLTALSVLLKTGIWHVIQPGSDNTCVGVCCMHPQQRELLTESGWELPPVLLAAAVACRGGDASLCENVGGAVEWALDACFTLTLPEFTEVHQTFTAAAARGDEAARQAADLMCITGNQHVSNVLHYLLLLAKQHTTLLAAAFDKQQALSAAASSSNGRSSTASPSSSAAAAVAASVSAHSAAVYSLYDPLIGLANLYLQPRSNKFAAVAWIHHSGTAATVMDILTRSVLSRNLSTSSSGGSGSGGGSILGEPLGAPGGVSLGQLQKYGDLMLRLLLPSVLLPKFASPLIGHALDSPFRGGDQRQLLFGLAVSHTKRCSTTGALLVEPSLLEAFARLPAYFGCMLAAQLAEEYSLAAVRAAVAPWLVLLGRLMRVTGYVLRQRLSSAADLAKAGGGVMLEAMGGEYVMAVVRLVKAAQRCLSAFELDEAVKDCWLAVKAASFTGQKHYPDPVAEAEAAGSSSSSSAPLLHSKYHLQRPGMPVAMAPVATMDAAAAAAGGDGSGGGTNSDRGVTANARTPSSSATAAAAGGGAPAADPAQSSSSSTAQECVLLDDLDSWFELHLAPLSHTTAAATGTLSGSGVLQYSDACEHGSSQHMSAARPLKQLISGSHSVQLKQLPEQLYAAGTALCNALAVPWLCNNPDCTNMSGESEALLVGGKSFVCGSCKVARYCGRACQTTHWKQHKSVCKRLAARAAGAAAATAPAVAAATAGGAAARAAASTPQA